MRVNRIENPLGFDLGDPSFSWTVEDTPSHRQTAARLEVFCGGDRVYDSGRRQDLDSLGVRTGLPLRPRTRYTWRVTVWGDEGDWAESAPAWFETAKLDEPWAGVWVAPSGGELPCIQRELELREEAASARIYASGLGLYRLFINGQPVSAERLAPGLNCYDRWVQYQTYDVGGLLRKGKNTVAFYLGGGIAKGRFSSLGPEEYAYCPRYTCIAELRVREPSGGELVLGTDESWQWRPSPVVESSVYDGERVDPARTGPWKMVERYAPPVGPLRARLSLPVTIRERRQPLKLIHTPKGETVLDLGQNMVGWLRFRVREPKGTALTLRYGEILQDGCFFRDNLRTAKAEFHYLSDGEEAVAEPWFTWYGFRYVLLEGFTQPIRLEDFTGCVVSSSLEETGSLVTADPRLNRLIQNALWSQRDNFLDVPTDCPQRDEREGWTGDAQVFSDTACYSMDCYAFYTKYLADMWEEQQKHQGCVPYVVPNARERVAPFAGGAVGWADAATVIPWTVWRHYGDKTILERQIGSMEAWTDWAAGQEDWASLRHFGDWLALDHPEDADRREGGTENEYLCLSYLYYSASLTAKAETVLGREDKAERYRTLAGEQKRALQEKYFDAEGKLRIHTQTACVIALYLDLSPRPERTRQALSDLLRRDGHLTTGFLGTPWLLWTLPDEAAWTLLLRDEYPSWLYEVKLGATTIWERWNSLLPDGRLSDTTMNSLNHYAYGSVVAWMYGVLCGLRPSEEAPGFRRVLFAPKPDRRLGWAQCSLQSAAGRIDCGWQAAQEGFQISLTLPFGCEAAVTLPDGREETAYAGAHTYFISYQ